MSEIDVCVICRHELTGKTRRGAVINRIGFAEFEMHEECARLLEHDANKRRDVLQEGQSILLAVAPNAGHA